MNISIKLYWQHDPDLAMLRKHPDFDFNFWMKEALKAFSEGNDDFIIPFPDEPEGKIIIDNCYCCFTLTEEENPDEIEFLKKIRTGFRTNALKQIFRYYLEEPALDVFFNQSLYVLKGRPGGRKAMPKEKKRTIAARTKNKDDEALNISAAKGNKTEEPAKKKNKKKKSSSATKEKKKPSVFIEETAPIKEPVIRAAEYTEEDNGSKAAPVEKIGNKTPPAEKIAAEVPEPSAGENVSEKSASADSYVSHEDIPAAEPSTEESKNASSTGRKDRISESSYEPEIVPDEKSDEEPSLEERLEKTQAGMKAFSKMM